MLCAGFDIKNTTKRKSHLNVETETHLFFFKYELISYILRREIDYSDRVLCTRMRLYIFYEICLCLAWNNAKK